MLSNITALPDLNSNEISELCVYVKWNNNN